MNILEATEGLVLSGEVDVIGTAASTFQTYLEKLATEAAKGKAEEEVGKTFVEKISKFLGGATGTTALNATVACITNLINGERVDPAEALASAAYSVLATETGATIGTVIGGPVGTIAGLTIGAVLDCIGSTYLSTYMEKWHEGDEFAGIELKKEEYDNSSLGIVEGDGIPAGTTVFSAARKMKQLGFDEESTRYLTSEITKESYKDSGTLDKEKSAKLQAILDYFAPNTDNVQTSQYSTSIKQASVTTSGMTAEELNEYQEVQSMLNNDKEAQAYAKLIYDNYHSAVKRARGEVIDETRDAILDQMTTGEDIEQRPEFLA